MKRTAADKGIRTNFGKRAKVPHYVRGHVLIPCPSESNCTILAPKKRDEAATIFPSLRLAERAVARTFEHYDDGELHPFEIRQVL